MTISDLIGKLEIIQDKIDIDADPDVYVKIGAQEVKLTGILYQPETTYNYESVVLF